MERRVLTPIRHKQIDILYRSNKAVFDRGITAAIHIGEQADLHKKHKARSVSNSESCRQIDNYLNFMKRGIELGVDAMDLGMWLQGIVGILEMNKNAKV